MNDIIRQLPDSVANQIAAGEVIQRPSSVIKELMENAIDAGASMVQVLVTDAGRTCIQVIDNGKGMSETDARMAFERHATSKIRKADDLFELRTMGFRGEALPSIAAIAEVELRTRRPSDELGTSVTIAGSVVTSQEPVSCPVGANFSVRNLFYNVPARRKFLKSDRTEQGNIVDEFVRITLAHPDVAFTLTCNNQQLYNLPAGNFHKRIIGLFKKSIDAHLLPVSTDTDLVRIDGFVGTPESARKKKPHQFFITNSRFMYHSYFAKAVQTAFERFIPDGYQVPFFLRLEVDPGEIDVNVSPTKTDIKFTDEVDIWHILTVAVREALGKFNAVPSLDFTAADRPEIPAFAPASSEATTEAPIPPTLHIDPQYNPFGASSGGRATSSRPSTNYSAPAQYTPSTQSNDAAFALYEELLQPAPQEVQPSLFEEPVEKHELVLPSSSGSFFQYRGQYIITTTDQGLLLIDQHRASERILYDQFRQRMTQERSATQGLLFPQIIELSPTLFSVAEDISEDLTTIGFNISNLGGGSYSVLGVPTGTEGLDPVALLQSVLDDVQSLVLDDAGNSSHTVREKVHHIIAATMARKAALPVGEVLAPEVMAQIYADLMASSVPAYTAEGKLVYVVLASDHISRLFS